MERVSLELQAHQRSLNTVQLFGIWPRANAMRVHGDGRFFLYFMCDPVYTIKVTSKPYGYLAVDKPVLEAADSKQGRASMINDIQAGIVCPPDDVAALAGAEKRTAQS